MRLGWLAPAAFDFWGEDFYGDDSLALFLSFFSLSFCLSSFCLSSFFLLYLLFGLLSYFLVDLASRNVIQLVPSTDTSNFNE
jgi:hypothetical protein